MKFIAALLALGAAASLAAGLRLLQLSYLFYTSEAYAPNSSHMPSYSAGGVEADGGGIFLPAGLLLLLGLFLGKFAFNLWRAEQE